MNDFTTLGLPQNLIHALSQINFTTPTPIQAQAIPTALEGRDVLGSAQTGTGKTGAFVIPLLTHLMKDPQSNALVMTPTRELAAQVMKSIQHLLAHGNPMRTALLIGGEPMPRQFNQLRQGPRIIVGTPGRINDHLARRTVHLDKTSFLVLDETDRMLDMGFGVQIDKILKFLPARRQTLMFSATLPAHILKMSQRYLKDPARIAVGSTATPIEKIKQEVMRIDAAGKYIALVAALEQRSGSIIVFVKTKYGAEKMAKRLSRENHSADAIHGDLRQSRRDRVISDFRARKHRILVATDVAARGLDIPHIEHVINYDMPQCPEDYIHRIGRTARAGAEGQALNLLTPEDGVKWRAIQRLINPGAGQEQSSGAPHERNERRPNNYSRRHKKPFHAKGQHHRKDHRGGGFKARNSAGAGNGG